MAASQARLLSITARLTNNENSGQSVSYSKQRLADQTQQITNEYNEALNATKLTVLTGFNGADATYTDISYTLMTGPEMAANTKQYVVTDTKGKVTIGYGSMFNNVERFKKLPLYYQNRLATPEEKEEEFYMLRDKVVRRGYLELPTPEMKALAMEHLKWDLMSVRRKFKDFDNLPKNAQLVILDMEYNMGATKFQSEEGKWPHFFEAVGKRDWFWAGNESGSPDVQLERNEWRKNMLHSIEE